MNKIVSSLIYREAEETGPELRLPVIEKLGLGLEQSGEEIAVPVLVLAPVLKVLEDRVELVLWVLLEMPVNGNVPPVTNLLRQVCRVEDELWLEECVFPSLCQESQVQCQVKIRQSFVQEPA